MKESLEEQPAMPMDLLVNVKIPNVVYPEGVNFPGNNIFMVKNGDKTKMIISLV